MPDLNIVGGTQIEPSYVVVWALSQANNEPTRGAHWASFPKSIVLKSHFEYFGIVLRSYINISIES